MNHKSKDKTVRQRSAGVSRRRFLGAAGTLLALPCFVPARALGAGGVAAPSERITTALIGAGGRGGQIVAGGDQVVAVCDVDATHRQRAQAQINSLMGGNSCAAYGDFREVLAREDIDAVIVATPDHWHVPIALAAVRAGKAVYVEKPLTLYVQQGRVLADAVRRYFAIVQVGSQQRSDAKFIRACELVRNGRIGELKVVKVNIPTRSGSNNPWRPRAVPPELDYEMWLGPAPWSPYQPDRVHYKFRFVSDFSGGDVTNWGAHQLDIAQMGIGADESGPVEVVGRGKRNESGIHDVFYDVEVNYFYQNGVRVELRSGGNGVRFEGTEGWVYVDRGKLEMEPASLATTQIGPDEIHLAPQSTAGTHMGIWLDAIRKRNPKLVNVPVEVGHRSATVCHLANIAMELKRPLRWDPAAEQFLGDEEANRMLTRTPREPWRI